MIIKLVEVLHLLLSTKLYKIEINLDSAVNYHYNNFPPESLNYSKFIKELIEATDAIARYDQLLKTIHNSEILLAPLRNQEAIISFRMEGTVSTMDEILKLKQMSM